MTVDLEETIVGFKVEGQRVEGDLMSARGVRNAPIVLMLHGFTGVRNEANSVFVPEGLFGRAARALARKGIASLRIDFRGSGQSEGDFADMTIERELQDAIAALDFLAARKDVDTSRQGVLGMSLGGVVSTALAGRHGHRVTALGLWNPGINVPFAFTAIMGMEAMQAGLAIGGAPMKLPVKKDVNLKGGFFHSLFSVVPAAELTPYPGPVFLGIGTQDDIVFPQPTAARALLSYHRGRQFLWQSAADHTFDVDLTAETVDELVNATADFFEQTLNPETPR